MILLFAIEAETKIGVAYKKQKTCKMIILMYFLHLQSFFQIFGVT